MKKILVAVVAAAVLSFAGATLAQAQGSTNIGLFKAPFQFIVGGKLMPAGTYRVVNQTGVLFVQSTTDSAAAFAATTGAENPYSTGADVHVEFKNIDGTYFLSQVALPGQDARKIVLTKANAERMLAKLNLMPAERANGQ